MPTAILTAAGLFSFLLCFPVYRFLKLKGVIDRPNARSSHTSPTVRGGGLAIVGTILLGIAIITIRFPYAEMFAMACGTLLLAGISWIDDIRTLRSSLRFIGHALAAGLFLLCLGAPFVAIGVAPGAVWMPPWPVSLAVGFLWIVGYTNAFNFMDGINGISGAQAGITGVGMGTLAGFAGGNWSHPAILLSMTVAGAACGFLPHNFPRARMFMGDVSSAPLGFLLAALVLWLAGDFGWWLLVPLALLHANYVLDTAITLVRRVRRREKWYEAHREHFYQRLTRAGRSHVFVTSSVIALQMATVGLMYLYVRAESAGRLCLALAVVGGWAAFFLYCELRFRERQMR